MNSPRPARGRSSSASPRPASAAATCPTPGPATTCQDETTWTLTYGVAESPPWRFPARNYVATARVIPLTEQTGAVIDWSSRFDCDQAVEQEMIERFQGLYRSFIGGLDADLRASRV